MRRTSGLYVLEDVFVKALQAGDFLWVKFIDPYGDTVLNSLQIPHFLDEWNRLSAFQSTDAEARALQEVRDLAEYCLEAPGRYLRFYGD